MQKKRALVSKQCGNSLLQFASILQARNYKEVVLFAAKSAEKQL